MRNKSEMAKTGYTHLAPKRLWWLVVIVLVACFEAAPSAVASLEVVSLQKQIDEGNAVQALETINQAVQRDPENAKLLYDLAVAAYGSKRFDDALVSLDRVEALGNLRLQRMARFQRGNTEYRLGAVARGANLDETIARWKSSLEAFESVIKDDPRDSRAKSNADLVRSQLVNLLVEAGKRSLDAAHTNAQSPMRNIEELRNAFDKFSEAEKVAPENTDAKQGEQQSREELSKSLTRVGQQLVQAPLQLKFNRREPSLPDVDTRPLDMGIDMLEEAKQLKPLDQALDNTLDQARKKLADARVMQAETFMSFEQRITIPREKLALLRMAREEVDKALERVPNHSTAKQDREEIDRRLAQVHEDEGDHLNRDSDNANLEQQAMWLSQALDHYQQAEELLSENDESQNDQQQQQQQQGQQQPQNGQPQKGGKPQKRPGPFQTSREQQLQKKEQDTRDKLADALDKLADKLMQSPEGQEEAMEAKAARLEGAEQALNELMGMKPSDRTQQRSDQVGKELDSLRKGMAQQGKKPGGQQGEDGQQMAGQQDPNGPPQWMGAPIDAPPRINTPGVNQPGGRGTHSIKDY